MSPSALKTAPKCPSLCLALAVKALIGTAEYHRRAYRFQVILSSCAGCESAAGSLCTSDTSVAGQRWPPPSSGPWIFSFLEHQHDLGRVGSPILEALSFTLSSDFFSCSFLGFNLALLALSGLPFPVLPYFYFKPPFCLSALRLLPSQPCSFLSSSFPPFCNFEVPTES